MLLNFDLSGADWVTAAYVSRDPAMLDVVKSGRSPHNVTGARICGVSEDLVVKDDKLIKLNRDPDVIAATEAARAEAEAATQTAPVHPRGWGDPEEGPNLDADRFAALGAKVTAAYNNDTVQACLKAWASQGRTNNRPFTPGPDGTGTIVISERRAAIFDAAIAADKQELEEQKVSGQLELEALRVGAQINESKNKAQFEQERAGVQLGVDIAKSKAQQLQQAMAAASKRGRTGE